MNNDKEIKPVDVNTGLIVPCTVTNWVIGDPPGTLFVGPFKTVESAHAFIDENKSLIIARAPIQTRFTFDPSLEVSKDACITGLLRADLIKLEAAYGNDPTSYNSVFSMKVIFSSYDEALKYAKDRYGANRDESGWSYNGWALVNVLSPSTKFFRNIVEKRIERMKHLSRPMVDCEAIEGSDGE